MLFVLMALGAADVVGRYVFNRPILGTMEISEVLLAGVLFFGWAYTQATRGHIRVNLLLPRFSPRVQAMTDTINSILGLVLFSLIGWQAAQIAIITGNRVRNRRFALTILIGAMIFSVFLTVTSLPSVLAGWITGLGLPPIVILVLILLMYIPLGALMDALPMILLTLPIVFSIVESLGFDLILVVQSGTLR